METVKIEQHTRARLPHYVKRLVQQPPECRHLQRSDKGVPTVWRLMILLALLCPGNAIAQSQINQNAIPDNTKNASAQEQPATIKTPFVVTISPHSDAEKKSTKERQQRKDELDSRLVEYTEDLSIFTKVLAGAAILQLFVFGYQAWT